MTIKIKETGYQLLIESKHYSFKWYASTHNQCNQMINSAKASYEHNLANESKQNPKSILEMCTV